MGAVIGSICKKMKLVRKKTKFAKATYTMITDSVCVRPFDLLAIYCQKLIQYFYNYPHMNKAKYDIPIWILMVFMNS